MGVRIIWRDEFVLPDDLLRRIRETLEPVPTLPPWRLRIDRQGLAQEAIANALDATADLKPVPGRNTNRAFHMLHILELAGWRLVPADTPSDGSPRPTEAPEDRS